MSDRHRREPPEDPYRLLKYVAVGAADGVAGGWAVLLILLHLDVAGFGTLVHGSPDGTVALLALLLAFGSTFSLVGLGWRIMVRLPKDF